MAAAPALVRKLCGGGLQRGGEVLAGQQLQGCALLGPVLIPTARLDQGRLYALRNPACVHLALLSCEVAGKPKAYYVILQAHM